MRFDNAPIRVYKTPLDSRYKNVYDDYTSYEQYKSFLDSNFDYYEIDAIYVKSVMDNDGNFSLDIANHSSMQLHDYNYICFSNEGSLKFAFIVSIKSQNDNAIPSCRLECHLDAWTNHYLEIKDKFSSVKAYRAHFDNNTLPNQPLDIMTEEFNNRSNFVKFLQSDSDKVVLWQKIVTSDAPTFDVSNPQDPHYTPAQSTINNGGCFALFIPLAILTIDANNYLYFLTNTFRVYGIDFVTGVRALLATEYGGFKKVYSAYSSYVVSNELCYSVPFKYTITQSGTEFIVELDNNQVFLSGMPRFGNVGIVDDGDVIFPVNILPTYSRTTHITIPRNTRPARYSTNLITNVKYDKMYNEFPFRYYSILYSGNNTPILPISGRVTDLYIKYQCHASEYPTIFVNSYGNTHRISTVETQGQIDVRNIALDEYLARNQNSLTLSYQKIFYSAIKGGIGIATSIITGVPSTAARTDSLSADVWKFRELNAKMKDLENAPSSVVQNAKDPIANPFVLDLAILMFNEPADTSPIMQRAYDYHYNGYICNVIRGLFEKSKDVFDSVQGELSLSACLSNSDFNELSKAVSFGITKWHIGDEADFARESILAQMNRNVANFNISEV